MKYLIIYDLGTGYAEIGNVMIVDAETEKEAKEEGRKLMRFTDTRGFDAFLLEDLKGGWSYYV